MWSIFALGPAVLFVCYISACRGFFQGAGEHGSPAVSQIIEALRSSSLASALPGSS